MPGGHPLLGARVNLEPFEGAPELAELATKELGELTKGDDADLAVDVLGLLTAAAGGLSVSDLAALRLDGGAAPTAADRRHVRGWLRIALPASWSVSAQLARSATSSPTARCSSMPRRPGTGRPRTCVIRSTGSGSTGGPNGGGTQAGPSRPAETKARRGISWIPIPTPWPMTRSGWPGWPLTSAGSRQRSRQRA